DGHALAPWKLRGGLHPPAPPSGFPPPPLNPPPPPRKGNPPLPGGPAAVQCAEAAPAAGVTVYDPRPCERRCSTRPGPGHGGRIRTWPRAGTAASTGSRKLSQVIDRRGGRVVEGAGLEFQ